MNKQILLLALASMGIAWSSAIAAATTYCNQNFDPVVGQYLVSAESTGINPPVTPLFIAGQLQLSADGMGRYADSAHFGQSVVWDRAVDGPLGILSSDGYGLWKKTSGSGNYKLFVAFVLGYPTVLNDVGVFPTKDFIRYVALGTATLSKDCSTLTATTCHMVFPTSVDNINPNALSCDGLRQDTIVFRKIPNL